MKNVRIKVFETNSSSTHSISIYAASKGIYDTIAPNELGQVVLTGGQFGWEWAQYNDAATKANYAAIFADGDKKMTDMLVEVVKDHTGAKEVVLAFDTSSAGNDWSYIDHQSARSEGGDAGKAFDTPKTLKNWIFHPESYLFTGNDNDEEPPNFYDVEFGIEWTHQLEIEDSEMTEKFQAEPSEDDLKEAIGRVMNRHPKYPPDYRTSKKSFSFISWSRKDETGKEYDSFMKMNEGVLVLFKTKELRGEAYREQILDSKEIKFNLKKL